MYDRKFVLSSRYGVDINVVPTIDAVMTLLRELPREFTRYFLCLVARRFQLAEFEQETKDILFWCRPTFLAAEPERKRAFISLKEWLLEKGVTPSELGMLVNDAKAYQSFSEGLTAELRFLLMKIICKGDDDLLRHYRPKNDEESFLPWNSCDSEKEMRPAYAIKQLLFFYVGWQVSIPTKEMIKSVAKIQEMQDAVGKGAKYGSCRDLPQLKEAMGYITAFCNFLNDQIEDRLIAEQFEDL